MMVPWLALLIALWDFDRTAPPTDFLIVVESVEVITGTQRYLVAGVASGVCEDLPSGDSDDFCATLTCPVPGTFQITVESVKYRTRSNTVRLRVRDAACTQVEGATGKATSSAGVPAAAPCRQQKPVVIPPVTVEVPALETYTVAIPKPHTTAPVIPVNPQVIPKTPHEPGAVALPTLPPIVQAPRPTTESPPPLTVTVPTGKPTPVTVNQPPVTVPGVQCP